MKRAVQRAVALQSQVQSGVQLAWELGFFLGAAQRDAQVGPCAAGAASCSSLTAAQSAIMAFVLAPILEAPARWLAACKSSLQSL